MITIFKELYNNIKTELKLCFYKLKLMGASLPDKYKSLNIIGKVRETLDKHILSPTGFSFEGSKLENLLESVEMIDVSKFTRLAGTFRNCTNVKSLDLSTWDISNVTSINLIFTTCRNLENLNVSNWNTSKISDMGYAFRSTGLKEIDLSTWDTSNVTSIYDIFDLYYISTRPLTYLNLSGWNMAKVGSLPSSTFRLCKNLKSLIGNSNKNEDILTMIGLRASITLFLSPLLRYSSMLALVKGVADLSSSESDPPTITFNSTCWKNMRNDDDTIPSSDIIAERQLTLTLIAASKNWNLAH